MHDHQGCEGGKVRGGLLCALTLALVPLAVSASIPSVVRPGVQDDAGEESPNETPAEGQDRRQGAGQDAGQDGEQEGVPEGGGSTQEDPPVGTEPPKPPQGEGGSDPGSQDEGTDASPADTADTADDGAGETPAPAVSDPTTTPPTSPVTPPGPADPQPVPVEPMGYRAPSEVRALVQGWLGSGVVELVEVGTSRGGRPIEGVRFGGLGATPLAERPTVLLVGGLDGVSLAGAETVMRLVGRLLETPDRLPEHCSFVAVPWANPDGLERWMASGVGDGRNDTPYDDDHDGAVDEDGPDDLDGDGLVLDLLIESPEGAWALADDPRLLRPARPGDAPRYDLAREGRDDDGDGRFNEDGPGGVVADRNFPLGWRGAWSGEPTGPWPLSEPSSRGLAELALGSRTTVVLLFQGNHGCLAIPGGTAPGAPPAGPGANRADGPRSAAADLVLEADRAAFEHVTRLFSKATGRRQTGVKPLAEARGGAREGVAVDWFYASLGALALEVSPWGPHVQEDLRRANEGRVREGRFPLDARLTTGELDGDNDGPRASASDRAWAAWLDNTRGGIGFLDWQPIDLGDGRAGLVGGWLPRTRLNPPEDLVEETIFGMDAFVLSLANDLPKLEVEVSDVRRESGEVVVLRARVRNRGALPTGVGPESAGRGTTLSLDLPAGVQLLVGERSVDLGHLPGNGASDELSWILVAPEGTVLTLRAAAPLGVAVEREVRP